MSYPQYEPPHAKPFGPEEDYPPVKEKKSHGCFFYGCITLIVLAVLALIAVGVMSFIAYRFLQTQVDLYTSTTRVPVPEVKMTEDQQKSLDERWAAFTKAADAGEPAEIVLTADEINALISENPEFKGKFYLTLKDDEATGQLSLPLEGMPMMSGRFLNAKAGLTVSLKDGYLDVRLKSIDVNGKTMPPDIAKQVAQENIAKNAMTDPKAHEKISKFKSLQIKDGKVYIQARVKEDEDAAKKGETKKAEVKKDEEPAKEAPKDEPPAKEAIPPKPADEPKAKPATPPGEPAKTDLPKAA
jgi:hypothetical protein